MIESRLTKANLAIGVSIIAAMAAVVGGLLYSCLLNPSVKIWQPQSIVFSPDGTDRQGYDGAVIGSFGKAIATDGNTIVIGSPYPEVINGKKQDAGVAYVYIRKDNRWVKQAQLRSEDEVGTFAYRIDISGNTIALLATGTGKRTEDRVRIYVFTRQGSTWSQQARILFPEALASATGSRRRQFGGNVAIDGSTLVVGGNQEAYVFEREPSAGTWLYQATLSSPNKDCLTANASCRFGGGVDISGNTVVVGSGSANSRGGSLGGNAHIFVRNPINRTWIHQVELRSASKEDWFATSVAIHQDTVVIGIFDEVWGFINGVSGIGGAYVYHKDPLTQNWNQEARLMPREGFPMGFNDFGALSATNGTQILLGTLGSHQKAAYLFSRNPKTNEWYQQAKITANSGTRRSNIQTSVAASDRYLVIGDPSVSNEQSPPTLGGFYVFDTPSAH